MLMTGTPSTESSGNTEGSQATLDLDGWTVEMLRAHRKRHLEERVAAGEVWENTGYVFVDETGQPVHPDRLYRGLKVRRGPKNELVPGFEPGT